jgi:uroporphyrinogen decarboxylase
MVHWENGISPTERFKATLRGEKLDRICVSPFVMGHGAKLMGYKTLGEWYEHPKVWMKCNMAVMEMYQFYPPPFAMAGSGPMTEVWGAKIAYPYEPKMGSITLIEPAVKKPEDVEKLEVPDRAATDRALSGVYEGLELAIERGLFPLAMIPGGFITSTAYSLTEPETFMFWLIKEPDLCHKLLDKNTEYGIRVAELLVEKFGAESWMPWTANPTDANVLISADTFAKFPLPRVAKLFRKVLELGVPMWWAHWCADHRLTIEAGHVEKIPLGDPGMLWFGPEVPMEQQVERWGKQHVLVGNIDPPSFLYMSFDELLELCRKNIEVGMKAERGYILGCGCEYPPPAPAANTYALTKAAREYGKY